MIEAPHVSISLESVSLWYRLRSLLSGEKYHSVLDNISVDIRTGQTLGVIGRNGAGKSTFLKLLAGIIAPNIGKVNLNKNKVVLLSYQLGFNRFYTGRQNAIYSAMLQGVGRDVIEHRLEEIIAFSGLKNAIDDPISTYSSGMKARLGFAVAIQCDADVILVDEALGVGDHEFRKKSMDFMRNWIRSDKTVVFVSHDERVVQGLCDRVLWLEGGRVVAEGDPEEIMHYYYKYDDVVTALANDLGMTEAEVRAHENNKKPIEVVKRIEQDLKEIWNREDRVDQSAIVRYCRPPKRKILSSLVREENGQLSWVENTRLITTGNEDDLKLTYEQASMLIAEAADLMNISIYDYRKSGHFSKLLKVLEGVSANRG